MSSLSEGVDALERQFMATAYANYAMLVQDTFRAGFGAFVAILPCDTGLTQFSASLSASVPSVFGTTIMSARGASAPVLGWHAPPSHVVAVPHRMSHDLPLNMDSVKVQIDIPSTEMMAKQFMRGNITKVSATASAARNAYDEPEMQAWLSEHGVGDVNVLTIRLAEVIANYSFSFDIQFKKRSQLKQASPSVIASLAK